MVKYMARIKPQALLLQSKKKKGPSQMSVATISVYVLVLLVAGFFLYTTYRHWNQRFVYILMFDKLEELNN